MRTAEPTRGGAWPHGMSVRVREHDPHLLTLLYLRSAWHLAPEAELPELDPMPEVGQSARPGAVPLHEWEARWRVAWDRAWAWYTIADPGAEATAEALRLAMHPMGPMHPAVPPVWPWGRLGVDELAFRAWEDRISPEHRLPLSEEPEQRNIDAVVAAWRSGIDMIVTLPFRGYVARRVGRRLLAVSAATRSSSGDYERALRAAAS